MHIKQRKILKRLVFKSGSRYSELQEGFEPEDRFSYHLGQLVKKGFAKKLGSRYQITQTGLAESSRIDTETLQEIDSHYKYIGLVIEQANRFLLHHKRSSLLQGWPRLPGGKPFPGEKLLDCCQRYLQIEAGIELQADFKFQSMQHRIIVDSRGKLLFDDWVVVFKVYLGEQQVEPHTAPHCRWHSLDEIEELHDCLPEVKHSLTFHGAQQAFYEDTMII